MAMVKCYGEDDVATELRIERVVLDDG